MRKVKAKKSGGWMKRLKWEESLIPSQGDLGWASQLLGGATNESGDPKEWLEEEAHVDARIALTLRQGDY